MIVVPALDLSRGEAVRIVGGRFRRYGDPWEWLARFEGAKRVHIVDLDAALGRGSNLELALEISNTLSSEGKEVQLGGGLRDPEVVRKVLEAGAVPILGTLAYSQPQFIESVADGVMVAVDIKDGRVMVDGWKQVTRLGPHEAVSTFLAMGVRRFLVTDVTADGMLSGPSTALELPHKFGDARFTYAGGVRSVNDLIRLMEFGFEAAVVGRALYETDLLDELVRKGWEV